MLDISSVRAELSSWVPVLNALLTPIIALLTLSIARQQWLTNRNKLKLDLFERRFAIYRAAVELINSILRIGRATSQATFEFAELTRSANFIVGREIMTYFDKQLYARAVELETLQSEVNGLQGQERLSNLHLQSELKGWFADQYAVLDKLFEAQLNLTH